MTWTGLPLMALLDEAGLETGAAFVSFESYSERDHHTSLPLDVAAASSWLVHAADGQPLSVDHGGPVRVFTEGRYFYKSLEVGEAGRGPCRGSPGMVGDRLQLPQQRRPDSRRREVHHRVDPTRAA